MSKRSIANVVAYRLLVYSCVSMCRMAPFGFSEPSARLQRRQCPPAGAFLSGQGQDSLESPPRFGMNCVRTACLPGSTPAFRIPSLSLDNPEQFSSNSLVPHIYIYIYIALPKPTVPRLVVSFYRLEFRGKPKGNLT